MVKTLAGHDLHTAPRGEQGSIPGLSLSGRTPDHQATKAASKCVVLLYEQVCGPVVRASVWSCCTGKCVVLLYGQVCGPVVRASVWPCCTG